MSKFFFKKDRSGLPITGSNLKATTKPSSSHTQVTSVIPAPIPNTLKPTFAGSKRYFVQMSGAGEPVTGTLFSSTILPEGGPYLEVFKNNLIALPLEANQNSGAILDTPEDLAEVPLYMSEEFKQNGYRTTGKL